MKFYKVYAGGSYIMDEIEADNREDAYRIMNDEECVLYTPSEYDHWFN